MTLREKPVVYHIPVCPFSQRLEILLELKNCRNAVDFQVVDITKPRPPALLEKSRGTTALPILETENGHIIKESLVILRYLEDRFPEEGIAQKEPYSRAVENMLIAQEGDFTAAGYRFVMNRDASKRSAFAEAMIAQYKKLDDFLQWHAPEGDFLFDKFGLAEVVFTPMFARFWFLDYYENFAIPEDLQRVWRWQDACLVHAAARQVSQEEIIKVYYDYALGMGNGALAPGRAVSSFTFEPHWSKRSWPPRDKWTHPVTDQALGLS
jgi:glutathione S-transferase